MVPKVIPDVEVLKVKRETFEKEFDYGVC